MKRYHISIVIPLLLSLFIYLFYRIDETNVNLLLSYFFDLGFTESKHTLKSILPIPEFIIYNLPEGLWVFSISLLGANLFIRIKKIRIHLIFLPITFAIALEIFQGMHITNGTFDILDVLISTIAWLLAYLYYEWPINQLKELQYTSTRMYAFLFVFACVYLSDINNITWLTSR